MLLGKADHECLEDHYAGNEFGHPEKDASYACQNAQCLAALRQLGE